MNEELRGKISYTDLRQIIFNYFKENQNLELSSPSIDYLKDKLTRGNDPRPFFIVYGEFGETRFDISQDDIQKVLKSFLASKNCELLNINYGDGVSFTYKKNPNINLENEEKVRLDITYDGSIRYEDLRQIIFDYYKENKGIVLGSISIDYLQDKLRGNVNNQPFFIRNDDFGESRFDISKEEIQEILKSYLASKNYELKELIFDNRVKFQYKQVKKQEQKPNLNSSEEPVFVEEESKAVLEQISETKEAEPMLVKDLELEKMEREKRKFTILQRERAMSEAQKGKNQSALMAGVCILGAAVAVYFNGQDVSQVLQHELNAIYSWEALGQYIQDLGPLTTLLAAGTCGFIAKYLKYSKKLKTAQHEFEDFNASLENVYIEELGGNEHVKSR